MSALESKHLELVIITYHDDFLKVAEIKEGVGGAYEKLAAVVGLSPDDLKLLGSGRWQTGGTEKCHRLYSSTGKVESQG